MGIRRIHLDLSFTLIGSIAGFVGFIAFNFYYYNYEAGLISVFAGILACVGFHLHQLYLKETLRDWYTIEIIRSIQLLAFIGILIGSSLIAWNAFLKLYNKNTPVPFYKSEYMTEICAFANLIYGIHLFSTLRRYSCFVEGYQSINSSA